MYSVEGFEFDTEEQAQEARREAEGIRYIKSQTNMKDAVTVLKLHNRLLQRGVFTTPVGYAFLAELREYINTFPYIDGADLEPMPEEMQRELQRLRKEEQEAVRSGPGKERGAKRSRARPDTDRREKNYRTGFYISTFLAALFAVCLIGVFVIAASGEDNVNIINYENALIDKYEKWEQELNEREEALREREKELNGR